MNSPPGQDYSKLKYLTIKKKLTAMPCEFRHLEITKRENVHKAYQMPTDKRLRAINYTYSFPLPLKELHIPYF